MGAGRSERYRGYCRADVFIIVYPKISNNSLDLGGCGEDVTYPYALIECLLRSPSQLDVRTGGSQQKLTPKINLKIRIPGVQHEKSTFALSGKEQLYCEMFSLFKLINLGFIL